MTSLFIFSTVQDLSVKSSFDKSHMRHITLPFPDYLVYIENKNLPKFIY